MEFGLVELLSSLEKKTDNLSQACDVFQSDPSDVSVAINSTFLKLHRLKEIVAEIQQIREKRDENNTKVKRSRAKARLAPKLIRCHLANFSYNFCPSFSSNVPLTLGRSARPCQKDSSKNNCKKLPKCHLVK